MAEKSFSGYQSAIIFALIVSHSLLFFFKKKIKSKHKSEVAFDLDLEIFSWACLFCPRIYPIIATFNFSHTAERHLATMTPLVNI